MDTERALRPGAHSARTLLLTLLGEYALPRGSVWTRSLVQALSLLDVEEKAARQAVARLASRGWIQPQRIGRETKWHLTNPLVNLLTDGAARIYGFGRERYEWDKTWLIVCTSVPEVNRDERYHLATRLTWMGLGSLGNGTWISPWTNREREAREVLSDFTLSLALVFRGQLSDPPIDAVAQAWNLSEIADEYETFIEEFPAPSSGNLDARFVEHTWLVHQWRRFPFLDPGLPPDLLPSPWSGATAADLFHERHAAGVDAARQWWAEMEDGDR